MATSATTGDTTDPVVAGAHLQSSSSHVPDAWDGWHNQVGRMPAGLSSFYLDYQSIVELHPDKTEFTVRKDEAGTVGVVDETKVDNTDTVIPDPMSFTEGEFAGLTSNGATRYWFEVKHFDKAGNTGENHLVDGEVPTNDWDVWMRYLFVVPYQPQAPTVAYVDNECDQLDLTIVPHASEHADVPYAIIENSGATIYYVDADGYLTEDEDQAEWKTVAGWGTARIRGLEGDTGYEFFVVARNYYAYVDEGESDPNAVARHFKSVWSSGTVKTTIEDITVTIPVYEELRDGSGNVQVNYVITPNKTSLGTPTVSVLYSVNGGASFEDVTLLFGEANQELPWGEHAFVWQALLEEPGLEISNCQLRIDITAD